MTTTNAWLQAQPHVALQMSLVFDGLDLVYTTAQDTSAIVTAFSGTDWTTVKQGLFVAGSVRQQIEAFAPRIQTSKMSFRIADVDGSLARQMMASRSSATVTYAKSDIDPSDTTIDALNTDDFAASGTIYIGHESIAYSAKAGDPDPSFTVSQRGKFSLYGPDGDDYFGRRHRGTLRRSADAGKNVTPEIRSEPDTFYNRTVALVLHHRETLGTSYSTVTLPLTDANAQVLFVGRIKEWVDVGDGTIEIGVASVHELLSANVFSQQFRGVLAPGTYLTSADYAIGVKFYDTAGGTIAYSASGTLGDTGMPTWEDRFYTTPEIIALIMKRIRIWTDAGTINSAHKWTVDTRPDGNGDNLVHLEVQSTTSHNFATGPGLILSPRVWALLGFGSGRPSADYAKTKAYPLQLERTAGDATLFTLTSPALALLYPNPAALQPGDKIRVTGESGEWMTQPELPSYYDGEGTTHGILKVGNRELAVYKTTSTIAGIEYTTFHVQRSLSGEESVVKQEEPILSAADPPQVSQVWVERGRAGEILLRALLSTGESAYNNATYDVNPAGFGLGVPYELVDVGSFESLDVEYELLLEKPVPFKEILEQVLTAYNRHLVFRDAQLALTHPGFDSTAAEDIFALNDDNKASEGANPNIGRQPVVYSPDGVINHIVLYYTNVRSLRDRYWSQIERADKYVEAVDETSISRFGGTRRTLEIKARGVLDPDVWAQYVAKPAIRYWAEPSAILSRSVNHLGFHLSPGDCVSVTDPHLVDPATGVRGASGVAAWVKSTEFDYGSGIGQLELYYLPGHPARYAKIAPAALMTSYNAGTKTATFSANAFSRSGIDGVDVSFFSAGDLVQFVERSPDPVSAPDILQDEIASVSAGANTVTLVTGISPAGGLTYVMEPREVASGSVPTTSQRNAYAFLADPDDKLINATYSAKTWAGATRSLDVRTSGVTYTQEFIRPADSDSDPDEPLSSRKLCDFTNNANVLLSYTTRNAITSMQSVSASSTAYRIAYKSIWFPLYGCNPNSVFGRSFVGKVLLERNAGTTTVKIVSSVSPPVGTSTSSYSYPGFSFSTEVTRSSAGQAWDDFTLVPAITRMNGMIGTWITVEVKNSSGSTFGSVRGISICETAIT